MPLKLNVGLSRKLGLPQYSSVGALCHLEVELPASLLDEDLEALHRHVRGAYTACRQAVHDELARYQGPPGGNGSAGQATPSDSAASTSAEGSRHAEVPHEADGGNEAFEGAAHGNGANGNGANGNGARGNRANGNGTRGNGTRAAHRSPAGQTAASPSGATQASAPSSGVTQRQLDYLCQLARQVRGLGTRRLDALSEQRLGKPIAALTGRDASQLIATLQSLRDGEIALEDVLDGGAP